MTPAIQKQIVKGTALFVFGALYAGYAWIQLPIGRLSNMGAGMFPLIIGSVVALFGLGFAVPALIAMRAHVTPQDPLDRWEKFDWRGALAVSVAIAAFAAIVGRFGLIPATLAMTAIAAFGNRKITPLMVVLLSAGFLITTYAIFVLGLNLPLDFWNWPF
jgi:hypothetical protein